LDSNGGNLNTARFGVYSRLLELKQQDWLLEETPPTTAATEEYNGTSWTAGGSMNTARGGFSRSRNSNSSISFWWLHYNST
jgi:hypothetical protein